MARIKHNVNTTPKLCPGIANIKTSTILSPNNAAHNKTVLYLEYRSDKRAQNGCAIIY